MRDALSMLFEGPNVAQLQLTGETGMGRPKMTGEMVLLPLKSDLGDVSRILGCLVTKGAIGVAPRRFDIAAQAVLPLDGTPGEVPGPTFTSRAPGFAEPGAPYRSARTHPVPYLRLVQPDK